MKVIGKTDGGYLVEASGYELAQIAGSHNLSDTPGAKQARADHGYEWQVPIGTKIEVTPRFAHLTNMEKGRDQALQSAAALRGLAGLIEKSIPEGLILPPAPQEGLADV